MEIIYFSFVITKGVRCKTMYRFNMFRIICRPSVTLKFPFCVTKDRFIFSRCSCIWFLTLTWYILLYVFVKKAHMEGKIGIGFFYETYNLHYRKHYRYSLTLFNHLFYFPESMFHNFGTISCFWFVVSIETFWWGWICVILWGNCLHLILFFVKLPSQELIFRVADAPDNMSWNSGLVILSSLPNASFPYS